MLLIVPERSAHDFSGGCMATTAVAPGTIKVAQNYKPGAGIQVVNREIPEHGPGQVRLSLVTNEEESLLARARAGDTSGICEPCDAP